MVYINPIAIKEEGQTAHHITTCPLYFSELLTALVTKYDSYRKLKVSALLNSHRTNEYASLNLGVAQKLERSWFSDILFRVELQ